MQFVLFGAMGDLSWRLIGPALYNLHRTGQLPGSFTLVGVDRAIDTGSFRSRLRDGIERFSGQQVMDEATWADFAARLDAVRMDLGDMGAYNRLRERIGSCRNGTTCIYYLALPPFMFASVADGLASAGLHRNRDHSRIAPHHPHHPA